MSETSVNAIKSGGDDMQRSRDLSDINLLGIG